MDIGFSFSAGIMMLWWWSQLQCYDDALNDKVRYLFRHEGITKHDIITAELSINATFLQFWLCYQSESATNGIT